MDAYAKIDATLPAMEGWCTPEKGRRMARLVIESKAKLCVELGVFGGRSLVAMAFGLAHNGSGRADGIDPFTKEAALEGTNSKENAEWWSKVNLDQIMRGAQQAIDRNGLAPFARIIRARSQDVVAEYADGSIDVLHQDSNHSEEVSTTEVRAWLPKVRPGGYWVFDDMDWSTTASAQALLKQNGVALVENHGSWAIFQKGG